MSHLLPPARGDRAFTVRDAVTGGLTRSALRTRAFAVPAFGSRVLAPDDGVIRREQLLDAIRTLARDDQFFSHSTAALIHRMPLPPTQRDGPIHLASPSFTARMRRPDVVGHRIKADVVEVDGVRVECPVDTFVHLATLLGLHDMVAVADWLLQPRNRVGVSKADLVARLDDFRGAHGRPTLYRAIEMARVGVESPQETRLRLMVTGAGHPEPELNVDVFDADGTFVARVDMAWPNLRVALEYDGDQHRTDPRQFARDIERLEALERLGWVVIRVTKEHMRDPRARVLPRVREALRRVDPGA